MCPSPDLVSLLNVAFSRSSLLGTSVYSDLQPLCK